MLWCNFLYICIYIYMYLFGIHWAPCIYMQFFLVFFSIVISSSSLSFSSPLSDVNLMWCIFSLQKLHLFFLEMHSHIFNVFCLFYYSGSIYSFPFLGMFILPDLIALLILSNLYLFTLCCWGSNSGLTCAMQVLCHWATYSAQFLFHHMCMSVSTSIDYFLFIMGHIFLLLCMLWLDTSYFKFYIVCAGVVSIPLNIFFTFAGK
jgi:hypothetical protein